MPGVLYNQLSVLSLPSVVAPAGFAPESLSGWALLLNGSNLSGTQGQAVSVWPDTSGNSANATQATTAKCPALGKIGSGNALSFDGANRYVAVSNVSNIDALSETTFEAVIVVSAPPSTLSSYQTIINRGNHPYNTAFYVLQDGNGYAHRWDDGTYCPVNTADGNAHIVFYQWTGPNSGRTESATTDGGATVVKNGCTNDFGLGDALNVGVKFDSGYIFTGQIALVGIMGRAFTSAERASIRAYAATTWGTPS